jgi:hypothetical protein
MIVFVSTATCSVPAQPAAASNAAEAKSESMLFFIFL